MAEREAHELKPSISGSSARQLFIGGISMEITEESLRAHFGQFGDLADFVLKRDKVSGRRLGFGFVTYVNPEIADEVLKLYHNIDSKEVDVKIPVTYRQRIHVGGLPLSLTAGELKEYFSSYGNVVGHQIILDKTTGRSRGFGFVSFDEEEAVERVLSNSDMHELRGKQVKTTRVFPIRAGAAGYRGSSSGVPASYGRGYGNSGNGWNDGGNRGYEGGGRNGAYGAANGWSVLAYYGYGNSGSGWNDGGNGGYGGSGRNGAYAYGNASAANRKYHPY